MFSGDCPQQKEPQGFWVARSCQWSELRTIGGTPEPHLQPSPAASSPWVSRSQGVRTADGECLVPEAGDEGPCVGEGRWLVTLWAAGRKHSGN